MDIKKTLMVGLIATSASGWLQAETLTFAFTTSPTSTVSFGSSSAISNIGTAFSGSLNILSVSTTGGSATCNAPCTLNFTTGALNSFSALSSASLNAFGYTFDANGSSTAFSAVTGTGGSLNNPTGGGTAAGGNATLANGTIGVVSLGGINQNGSTTSLAFSAPVTGISSTILAAFGLTNFSGGGTLSFNIILPAGITNGLGGNTLYGPNANGFFTDGIVSGGELSLNVSATPEPSSVLMIAFGLVGVAFIGRKRLLAQRP